MSSSFVHGFVFACARESVWPTLCVCTGVSEIAAGAISGDEFAGGWRDSGHRRGAGVSLLRLVYILNT